MWALHFINSWLYGRKQNWSIAHLSSVCVSTVLGGAEKKDGLGLYYPGAPFSSACLGYWVLFAQGDWLFRPVSPALLPVGLALRITVSSRTHIKQRCLRITNWFVYKDITWPGHSTLDALVLFSSQPLALFPFLSIFPILSLGEEAFTYKSRWFNLLLWAPLFCVPLSMHPLLGRKGCRTQLHSGHA